jgi:hypothetical protein
MVLGPAAIDGIVFAATVASDKGAERARGGWLESSARAVSTRMASLDALGPVDKRRALRALGARLKPVPRSDADLPARALALLAGEMPRPTASRWMKGAPFPRRGFVASRELKAALRTLAASGPRETSSAAEERERGQGRRLLAAVADHVPAATYRGWLARLDAEEASAIMSLRPLLSLGDAPAGARPMRHAVAAVFEADAPEPCATRPALSRRLGAVASGLAGETDADAPWSTRYDRQVGRELAQLEEAGCLE